MMNMPLNLTPPVINPNAEKVLSKRYYRKDENGQCVEDATGLFWRVASSIAAEEAKYEQSPWKPDALARAFYDMMTDWRFLPNSPTLMNAGSGWPAFGLLRTPRRRLHRRNFRRRKIRRHDPQVRRRHGLLLFPSAAQELPRRRPAAWPPARCPFCASSTPPPSRSSRAAPGAARTWASCASITRTSSNSSGPKSRKANSTTSTSP